MTGYGPGIGSEFGLSARAGYRARIRHPRPLGPASASALVANGRAALGLAARSLQRDGGQDRDVVLLPAYLCHSIIQPFVELGLRPHFYRVGGDLSVDPDDVLERVDAQTLAVVVVHYFGLAPRSDLAQQLADHLPGIGLIDDRTHLLLSDLHAGVPLCPGAIAVYSPRKWGPFPDLGIVLWPPSEAGRPLAKAGLDAGCDWHFALGRLWGGLLRALFFAFPAEGLRARSLAPLRRAESLLGLRVQIRAASPLSRFLWRHWDWHGAWRARRDNFRYLADHWPARDAVPLFSALGASTCPLGFPVRAWQRERLRERLIAQGIFAPIHWQRPVAVPAAEFPEAAELAAQQLTIPIDQRYGVEHMARILEVLCRN